MLNQPNGSRAGTGKFTAWEGGHREAGFAYWPRGIANPGRVSNVTLHVTDFLPTLAALPASRCRRTATTTASTSRRC